MNFSSLIECKEEFKIFNFPSLALLMNLHDYDDLRRNMENKLNRRDATSSFFLSNVT